MQMFDLEPFVKYIRERGLAKERNIPFYIQWVQKFLTADLPDIATSPRDRIQAFENLLSKNHTLKDWQVWQALKAVELYVKVFVTTTSTEPLEPDEQEKTILESERIYEQMRELIRVRHYSYRTEQTYLDWVRRYMGYALNHKLDWQKSDTVRVYLSFLATQQNVAASTQNQAFSALLFLLREVLKQENPDLCHRAL